MQVENRTIFCWEKINKPTMSFRRSFSQKPSQYRSETVWYTRYISSTPLPMKKTILHSLSPLLIAQLAPCSPWEIVYHCFMNLCRASLQQRRPHFSSADEYALICRINLVYAHRPKSDMFIAQHSPFSFRSCLASCCSSGLRALRARRLLVRLRQSLQSTRCTWRHQSASWLPHPMAYALVDDHLMRSLLRNGSRR